MPRLSYRRTLLRCRVWAANPYLRLGFFAVLALVFVWPLLPYAPWLNEFRDAQVLQAYEQSAVESVLRYRQWPLWNPYYCGGVYALGSPQTRFAAPPFLMSLLFGVYRGQVVTAFLMIVLGMEGTYRFARARTATALAPALLAPMLALSGLFATAFFSGWLNFFGFQLTPWVLFGVGLAARGRFAGVVVTALAFAFMIGFGGTYSVPLTAILAVFEALRWILPGLSRRRRLGARLWCLALAAWLSVALCAFRLWPVAETLAAAPRVMAGAPGHRFGELWAALFGEAEVARGYIGPAASFLLPLPLTVLAAIGLSRRRGWGALVLLVLCFATAFGYGLRVSPFAWLRELPVLSTLRYPERFLFFVGLYAVELAALGLGRLVELSRRRPWFGLLWAPALLVIGGGLAREVSHVARVADGMWLAPPPRAVERPFRQARGNRWLAAYHAPLGRGSLSCWEAYPVPQSPALRGDLPEEFTLDPPGSGTVRWREWTPNRLDLEVELGRPARLLINQNWHAGWRVIGVGEVVSDQGRLAIDLPAGVSAVTLRFLPRSALGGAFVSLFALLALWGLARTPRPSSPGRAALAWAVAPAVGAALSFLVPEAPTPAPTVRNANGLPAIVESLPADVTPAFVEFALPVELVGYHLPRRVDADDNAEIELYWRVTGKVPRSLGVFVQVDSAGRRRVGGDHQAIAASLFFDELPQGVLVRDVQGLHLGAGGGEWSVHVGLWHASGDGSRVAVSRAGRLTHADGRVRLGTIAGRRRKR